MHKNEIWRRFTILRLDDPLRKFLLMHVMSVINVVMNDIRGLGPLDSIAVTNSH